MPFSPSTMTSFMMTRAGTYKMRGSKLEAGLKSISSGICLYMTASAKVTSYNNVIGPGAGTYTGFVVGVVPSAMSGLMMGMAGKKRISGKNTKQFFDIVSFGVCQTLLTTVKAQGVVIGGGPGVGWGNVVGLVPSAMAQSIISQYPRKALLGSRARDLATVMSFGICNHLMTSGKVITTCIGAAVSPFIPIIAAPGPGNLV